MVCGGPKEEMGGSLTGVKLAGGAVGITVGPRRKLVTGGMRTRSITWITELPADKLGVTMEASSVPISIVPIDNRLVFLCAKQVCLSYRWDERKLEFPSYSPTLMCQLLLS